MYSEETDLCRRIKTAGWEIRHLPQMTILHHVTKDGIKPHIECLARSPGRCMRASTSRPCTARSTMARSCCGHFVALVYCRFRRAAGARSGRPAARSWRRCSAVGPCRSPRSHARSRSHRPVPSCGTAARWPRVAERAAPSLRARTQRRARSGGSGRSAQVAAQARRQAGWATRRSRRRPRPSARRQHTRANAPQREHEQCPTIALIGRSIEDTTFVVSGSTWVTTNG